MNPTWTPLSGPSHALALDVLINGPLSRAELARRLALSAGSLTRLTKPLVDSGLLVEVDAMRVLGQRTGRPQTPLDIVPGSHHFVGIKLTGEMAYGVLTNLRAEVVATEDRPLPSKDPTAIVSVISELVATLSRRAPSVTAVGISVGGHAADHTTVSSAPFLDWTDVPLGSMTQVATGLPTVVENDLIALTEAEHWFGAGRGLDRFAVLTIGAGVGYGLVIRGQVVTSSDAGLGPVGHIPLDPTGPLCSLGHRGCSTALLSIPAICAGASVALRRDVGYDEVLDLAEAGDPAARRIIDDAGAGLGILIALVSNLTMPQRVVISGEGVRLVETARPAIDAAIGRVRDPRAQPIDLDVRPGSFTQWARGAAVIAIQTYVLGVD
jgi:predicted NBD/HSP70 family sugar kinase